MARGGRTQGAKAATGQGYGVRKAQIDAQKAIPLPDETAVPPAPRPSATVDMAAPAPAPIGAGAPVDPGPFARPTERPTEPVTAGLPFGDGPGPEVLSFVRDDALRRRLVSLYQAHPNNELLRLLELHDNGY